MNDISKIVKKLKDKYGSVIIASDEPDAKEYISTGNLTLDLMLEGGIALGYAVEWSGLSGSGKSLMLQKSLSNMQNNYDGTVGIWVDRENAWTKDRAIDLGINIENTIVAKPQDVPSVPMLEEFLIDTIKSLDSDCYKFIAVDSISSFEKEGDKADMGKRAKSFHEFFRKILPYINTKTSMHFANQVTFKIGIMFGDPSTTTGGEAPRYYTTYRIKLDDRKEIKDEKRGGEIVGNWIKAKVIKTRQGPNFRTAYFPYYYKEGIDFYGGYVRMLADRNYVKPNNKSEFEGFKQHTISYKEDKRLSEFNVEQILEKYPELNFDTFPEWKEDSD